MPHMRAPESAQDRCPAIQPSARGCGVSAGAEGQIALRLVKELAAAGEKVVAGVADIERGQAALAFAKRYELLAPDALDNIRLAEVDYSDPDSFSLTAKGRLVVVDGDDYVGGRAPDVSVGFGWGGGVSV